MDITQLVTSLGLPTALLLGALWYLNKLQEKRDTDANEYRTFMLEEIKSLRQDAKDDKAMMRQLIADNTSAIQMFARELKTVDSDVTRLYELLAERRRLIKGDQ